MSNPDGFAGDRPIAIACARIWAHAHAMRLDGSSRGARDFAHLEAIESLSKSLLDLCEYQVYLKDVMEDIK